MIFGYSIAQVRKFLVAVVGVLGVVLTANLLPDGYDHWVSSAAAVITAALTYVVPNAAVETSPGEYAAPPV